MKLIIANFISYYTVVMLVVWLLLQLPLIRKSSGIARLVLIVVFAILSIVLPITSSIYGLVENLSITLFILLIIVHLKSIFNWDFTFNRFIALAVVVMGALLYLSVLAVIPYDFYSSGYHPGLLMLIGIFIIGLIILSVSILAGWIVLIALIAYYFNLQFSINLWDYLLDPVLWLFALISLFKAKPKVDSYLIYNQSV